MEIKLNFEGHILSELDPRGKYLHSRIDILTEEQS